MAATNFERSVPAEAPVALAAFLLPPSCRIPKPCKAAATARLSLQAKIVRYGV